MIAGKSTDAVRMIDSITSAAMTAPVKRFSQRPFTQGPSTALSLQSSSRKTVALGRSTPASVCTALGEQPERRAGGQHDRRGDGDQAA